uniref:CopD family protein n=1 Tax=Sandaracinus amylolyticus TaxID=927083 RepID=UPI00069E3EF6|nr:CopD family protein [Sandaracinus amylolyticus]
MSGPVFAWCGDAARAYVRGVHALYVISVWLHILAAITWIGGMFFLVLVVVPWMRRGERAAGAKLLQQTGARFRNVGWACFAVLLVTGTFQLAMRGVELGDFVDPVWLGSSVGSAIALKLGVFAIVLAISAVHDFVHGPRATRAVQADPGSREAERMRRRASMLGRVNVVLAMLLVLLGVVIVRGWP